MEKLIQIGRIFFAIAVLGLGIEHFVFEDFITGRAPDWPESIPGKRIWAYTTGLVFVGVSIAILSGKHARLAAILAAMLVFVWALLRNMPVLAADSVLSGNWTRAGKALTLTGGFLAIAAGFPKVDVVRSGLMTRFLNSEGSFIATGRMCLGIFLVITGIQHFMFTEFVASLIPGWFPGDAVLWTYFAGVALLAGGIGLFIPLAARLAALLSGIMVFSWFWIVHIPRTLFSVSDGIAVFEALAVSGMAFLLAGCLSRTETSIPVRKSSLIKEM